MRLRPTVPAAFAALLAAPAGATAQPACAAGTLEAYLGLGVAGCTIGSVTMRQFLLADRSTYDGGAMLTPYTRAAGAGTVVGFTLAFAPPLAASGTFSSPGGSVFDIFALRFVVDAGAGDPILGLRFDDLDASATRSVPRTQPASGTVRATGALLFDVGGNRWTSVGGRAADFCPGVGGRCGSGAFTNFGGAVVSGAAELAGAVEVTRPTIADPAPVTYNATLSGFTAGVYVASASTLVPEPHTYALLATGLALVAGARRRRKHG